MHENEKFWSKPLLALLKMKVNVNQSFYLFRHCSRSQTWHLCFWNNTGTHAETFLLSFPFFLSQVRRKTIANCVFSEYVSRALITVSLQEKLSQKILFCAKAVGGCLNNCTASFIRVIFCLTNSKNNLRHAYCFSENTAIGHGHDSTLFAIFLFNNGLCLHLIGSLLTN